MKILGWKIINPSVGYPPDEIRGYSLDGFIIFGPYYFMFFFLFRWVKDGDNEWEGNARTTSLIIIFLFFISILLEQFDWHEIHRFDNK